MVDSAVLTLVKRKSADPCAIKKLEALLEFLEQTGISFYNSEFPVVRERNEGRKVFVDVTISIRTSGESRSE